MPDLPEEGNIYIKQDLVKIKVTSPGWTRASKGPGCISN